MRMSEVLADALPRADPSTIGVLSGPNLAREIVAGQPAATCVAFPDPDAAGSVQELLMTPTLRVYTSEDVVGCEIGGALKNVIAIAAGVADGLGYGTNTKAALITRGLAELARLGTAAGGQPLTFLGLSGNGDLVATCSSPQSRNYRLGQRARAGPVGPGSPLQPVRRRRGSGNRSGRRRARCATERGGANRTVRSSRCFAASAPHRSSFRS